MLGGQVRPQAAHGPPAPGLLRARGRPMPRLSHKRQQASDSQGRPPPSSGLDGGRKQESAWAVPAKPAWDRLPEGEKKVPSLSGGRGATMILGGSAVRAALLPRARAPNGPEGPLSVGPAVVRGGRRGRRGLWTARTADWRCRCQPPERGSECKKGKVGQE
jgi:hypothetical protein